MMDCFSLLKFPRTPWLEPQEVQARFLELSSAAHPDRAHNLGTSELAEANRRFADLNKAAATLREPKDRLQHLLALETGVAPAASQNISDELIGLFSRIGETNRRVDQFLAERARATSPMMQAQLFAQALEWSDKVAALQAEVAEIKAAAESELKLIASAWPATKPLEKLQRLAHLFAMIARWQSQLQERFAALAV